ncbi:MAG: MBL fold metallo-hydrolase [Candidatus Riflebacteria bacterium]|nr:MBL fold metallo-hydrolase [Candidatus Riflebacteria bacterium]
MLGITFIGSGSKGNSALLELNNSYYLLDAGISCKKICDCLLERNLTLNEIEGIFLTHEHNDHIKGLNVLLKKAPHLKIYCTPGTASAIVDRGIPIEEYYSMKYEEVFEISGCLCTAFRVPHDAAQPMGLHITKDNYSMVMATDLGCVTPDVIKHTQDADLLCIESNYDSDMLKSCSYPSWLKQRIKSKTGHLPNEGVRGILSRMNKVPQSVVLMHLSQESNTKEKALDALNSFLKFDGLEFKNMHVTVASQDYPSERVTVGNELNSNLKAKLLNNINLESFSREALG